MAMTEAQFVCTIDSIGGLDRAFSAGIHPSDCPAGELRQLVEDAYDEWGSWSTAVSDYYDYVERG